MLKEKLTPDQIAMILADWTDGELTTCDIYKISCEGCVLEKEFMEGMTICQALERMSEKFNKVEV